ncbi:ABC transporter ATP-binding protein [Actinocatenispora rupis]|uniref:Multidrug ABC transporter ATP-binding protein n=1 Tax=Actinocatenispora rupis TaxID=519421 RepID=A0A8J3N8Y6_9ACTN|nr:ABC transporter ATP-binding protein [Actinocatenispora rupis]GID10596.1 multidrug ABC transporter ATP-binding protein [Actinocatenispora rupis]
MPVIEVRGLHKRYGEKVAVADVSFAVERGEIFGILGPNGAGKTTTVECVAGLRAPDGGGIDVLGLDPRRERDELRRVLGVQLQESALPDKITVTEALELYASFHPDPADWRALVERLGLGDRLRAQYRRLSGGQKQRLSVALALIGKPRIAVLDELTTGLDPQARHDIWDLIEEIRAGGVTVLLVTHFMAEAERLCDRVAVIDAGRVAALDTPAALTSTVDSEQRITFRPSRPVDDAVLAALPDVTAVTRTRGGDELLVTGTGNVLASVVGALASAGIVAEHLRVEQASLDDAYLALTHRGEGEQR